MLLSVSLVLAASLGGYPSGKVVVANRGSGTLSVIDVETDRVADTIPLPAGSNPPEPMYVTWTGNKVFAGDRANNRVAVYHLADLAPAGTIPAGNGVFHMWADRLAQQMWVVNDVDNTLTVIDPRNLLVLGTVPVPADLVAAGGKPHDVFVGADYAFVSVVGLTGSNDAVVQFDKRSLAETARASVGKDPHVSVSWLQGDLYVPAQNADTVHVLDRTTLATIVDLPVSGAHGAGMLPDGRYLYTTNLPGGGTGGLVTIDARSRSVLGTTDTPYPVPHNVTTTPHGRKVFVTHSGASSDKVTIYDANPLAFDPVPAYRTEVTTGLNPFGLAFVP